MTIENEKLAVAKQEPWSPRRMWLKFELRGSLVYWIQQRKTGARRGASPTWLDFDPRDAEIMRRLAACWNACRGIPTATLEKSPAGLGETLRGLCNRFRGVVRSEFETARRSDPEREYPEYVAARDLLEEPAEDSVNPGGK